MSGVVWAIRYQEFRNERMVAKTHWRIVLPPILLNSYKELGKMKASDTVLKPKDLIRLEESRETNTDIEASLIKQAEVSFNAGIQAWRNTLLQKKKKKGGKDIASHCNKGTKRDATGGLNETTM